MLILTKYIAKHEMRPLQKHFTIDDLLEGARKVLNGLGQKITTSNPKQPFKFYKVRITGEAKGRMIIFVLSESHKVVPVLIRLKKDKKFGMNMSASNLQVVNQIENNLDHIIEDIEKSDFEEFKL